MSFQRYEKLFTPVRLGPVEIPNRFALTATAEVFSHGDGLCNPRYGDYMVRIAKGGTGLLITGNRLVDPLAGTPARGYIWGFLRGNVPRDRKVTERVHAEGAKVFAQLNHFGAHGNSFALDDYRVLKAPSRQASPVWNEIPDELSVKELDRLADSFALCAALAREGGYDGVELHMTNAYLLHQFMSPMYNHREDEYGGSLENRLRFPLEVLARVKRKVGNDFAVGVRLTTNENHPQGMGPEAWREVARYMEREGKPDFFGFSAGTYHSFGAQVGIEDLPQYYLIPDIKVIREGLKTPIMGSGAMQDPEQNEVLVREGVVDVVGLSRPLLADPEYVAKVRQGRADEIRRCVRCNQGCIARLFKAVAVSCTVNPEFGRETFFASCAKASGRAVVVGGGPAGMYAACELAERGNHVVLYEASNRLGGQVNLLAKQPGRESFRMLVEDLERRLEKSGVNVKLGVRVDLATVVTNPLDLLVIATGSTPRRDGFSGKFPFTAALPGHDQDNVFTVPDVIENPDRLGARVLILDDEGSRYTAGVAELLLQSGKSVTLVTPMPMIFPGLGLTLEQPSLYARLFGLGLQTLTNCWVSSIDGKKAAIFNAYSGKEEGRPEYDSFVLSTGREPEVGLACEAEKAGIEYVRIGDCLAPRMLDHAIYDAALAGRGMRERYIHPGWLEQY